VRKTAIALLIVLLACPAKSAQQQRPPLLDFSAKAVPIIGEGVISPDGKKKIRIDILDENAEGFPSRVTVNAERNALTTTIRFGLSPEILWSPDSQAFAITGSSQGANGWYQSSVFYIRDKRLETVALSPTVVRAFGHPVKCGWPESPNVGAIRWLVPSQKILVAAEIIHHSNCDSFGTFKAYAVDLSGPRVERVYSQLEAKRLYGDDLGAELRQADDKCILDPRSCYVAANHQEPSSPTR
jgi:hypothetical protein